MGSLTFAALLFTNANAADIRENIAATQSKGIDVNFDGITRDALWDLSMFEVDIDEAIVITDLDYDVTTIVLSEDASLTADLSGLSLSASASVSATTASASFYGYASGPGSSFVSASSYSYVGENGSFASVSGSVGNATDSVSIDLSSTSFDTAIDLTLNEDISLDVSELEIIYVDSGETVNFGDYSVFAE